MEKIFIGVYGTSDKTEVKIEFENGDRQWWINNVKLMSLSYAKWESICQ